MPFRDVNTATLQAFLDAAASKLRRREHHWSNRTYADEQALVDEAVRSSRTLRRKDIRPICSPRWITPDD